MDAPSWAETLRNGYVLSQIYHAWTRTGVIAALREAGRAGASVAELACSCEVDERVLAPTLYYAALADIAVDKHGDRYALSAEGERLLNERVEYSLTAFVGAYGNVLEALPALLRGEARYGVEVHRRGDLLAIASFGATRSNFPFIVEELRRLGGRKVVDLGCGAAGVLIEFCRLDHALSGVGLDISPAAIAEARRRVDEAGLTGRIELIEGDITQIGAWKTAPAIAGADTFHCSGMLHELLRDGEEAVVALLRQLKHSFPGRLLFLGEFDGRTEADYRAEPDRLKRTKDLWYQDLIHPLTLQGSPIPRRRWLAILQRAGVELLGVQEFRHNVYVIRI